MTTRVGQFSSRVLKRPFSTTLVRRAKRLMPDEFLAKTFHKLPGLSSSKETYRKTLAFPNMIRRYLEVANAFHKEDRITLAHGQNSAWAVSQRVLEALGYRKWQAFHKREQPSRERVQTLYKKVRETNHRWSKHPYWSIVRSTYFYRDYDRKNSDILIPVTLGLFHTAFMESALCLAFGGNGQFVTMDTVSTLKTWSAPGNCSNRSLAYIQEIGNREIKKAMTEKGYTSQEIKRFCEKLKPIYKNAFELDHGQIIAIGIPSSLYNRIYHSSGLGEPLGDKTENILDSVEEGIEYQFRMIMDEDFLKRKDVQIVNIMEEREVDSESTNSVDSLMKEIYKESEDKEMISKESEFKEYKRLLKDIDDLVEENLSP